MSVTPNVGQDVRALLTPGDFDGVEATVRGNNPGVADELARRIVGEGLKFVATAARFRTAPISPRCGAQAAGIAAPAARGRRASSAPGRCRHGTV